MSLKMPPIFVVNDVFMLLLSSIQSDKILIGTLPKEVLYLHVDVGRKKKSQKCQYCSLLLRNVLHVKTFISSN